MPTPLFTPGAQLFPISLTAPAFQGLNTENAGTILDKSWATTLDNAIFDTAGRAAAREGFLSLTTTPGIGVVKRIFEYFKADGVGEVIYSTDTDIYKDTTTATSIEGTLTVSDGNIKFVNFNDKVIAFGIGTAGLPAVRTTGNFADIVVNSGTAPTSGIGTAAYGRLWGVDTDGKTIRFCALLDETRWAVADGGGIIDMSNVWPSGQDDIVAIEEFGGDMVVFGTNNTVIMTDGAGATLGINPLAMYVSDTIPGQGAISQFAIARATGDLWVLTPTGIVGLKRELVQRSTPITNLSKNVQSEIITLAITETDKDDITLMYSPDNTFVVAVFPTSQKQFVFDVRAPLQDGTFRASTWTAPLQTLAYIRETTEVLGSFVTVDGEIMRYSGNQDDTATYAFDYESGWLDLGEELNIFLKFVKRLTTFMLIQAQVVVTHKINYDFGLNEFILQGAAAGSRVAEYGQAEYGANGVYDIDDPQAIAGTDVAEYSGAVALRTVDAPGKGSGQYIQVGIRLDTNSGSFALQQINLYAKIGRHAT